MLQRWTSLAKVKKQREDNSGHKGKVIWFTGLPGSGKSTIANALDEVLKLATIHYLKLNNSYSEVRERYVSEAIRYGRLKSFHLKKIDEEYVQGIVGATIAAVDPDKLSKLWSKVLDSQLIIEDNCPSVILENANIDYKIIVNGHQISIDIPNLKNVEVIKRDNVRIYKDLYELGMEEISGLSVNEETLRKLTQKLMKRDF